MAIDFDGTDDYVTCGSGATIDDIFDGGGSLAMWFNLDALPGDGAQVRMAGQTDGSNTVGWFWAVLDTAGAGSQDNVIRFRVAWATNDGEWIGPDEQFTGNTGKWYHIIITYDADSATNDPVFYLNGTSVAVTELTAPTGANRSSGAAEAFEFGRASIAPLNGRVEDVRLFTRILTIEEAAVLAAGHRRPIGGEAGWWTCEDFQAVTHPDATTLAAGTNYLPDQTKNGNTGNPTGGAIARASDVPRYGVMF